MVKKIIPALICLVFTLTGYASQLTATLQSGDKLTPFYGSNAFVDAYNAAVSGDVITLSTGEFKATDIEKSITVIGTYGFGDDTSKATRLGSSSVTTTVTADNVIIEGIRATEIIIKGADNLTISRSEIYRLVDKVNGEDKYHDNTIIEDCRISEYGAMLNSKNSVIRNCAIGYFTKSNGSDDLALIENCNINMFYDKGYNKGDSYSYCQPYAIYRNNILRLYAYTSSGHTLDLRQPSEYHNNIFIDANTYSSSSSSYKKWTIDWGSVTNDNNTVKYQSGVSSGSANFGVDGNCGPVNHKEYPAIPEITSSEIDTQTDAEGNIHVKITAKARN